MRSSLTNFQKKNTAHNETLEREKYIRLVAKLPLSCSERAERAIKHAKAVEVQRANVRIF